MNSKILLVGIVFVLAIGFIFLLPYLNPTPNPYGGGLSCDVHYWSSYSNAFIDTTPGYLFECQENNANAKYYWKPDFLRVADVPSYFFDSSGKVIQTCGGMPNPCLQTGQQTIPDGFPLSADNGCSPEYYRTATKISK